MQKRTTTINGARRIGPDVARAARANGSIATASTMPRATIETAIVLSPSLTPPSRRRVKIFTT